MANFSVVTPNYNMGSYLAETIESVLTNLKKGDEYFIIDGGSTDQSVEIIKSYEKYLTGWVSEKDRGYAEALCKGFQLCTGEFQCWINSGDLLLKGCLELASEYLMATGADMIFGDDLNIDEQGSVIRHYSGKVRSLQEMMLYGEWTPLQDACYWRKTCYDLAGGIRPNLRFAADYALFLMMSCRGRCEYVPAVFSAFRRHAGQKSISGALPYKKEREDFRHGVLQSNDNNKIKTALWAAYYYFAVRWRARISVKLQRELVHRGIPVSGVKAFRF